MSSQGEPIHGISSLSHTTDIKELEAIIKLKQVERMEAYKKATQFACNLILGLINQINLNMLTEKGAGIKIMRILEVTDTLQVSHDDRVKRMMDKLLRVFESSYKKPFVMDWKKLGEPCQVHSPRFKMNVDMILDSNLDPAYTDKISASKYEKASQKIKPTTKANKIESAQSYQSSQENLFKFALRKAMTEASATHCAEKKETQAKQLQKIQPMDNTHKVSTDI